MLLIKNNSLSFVSLWNVMLLLEEDNFNILKSNFCKKVKTINNCDQKIVKSEKTIYMDLRCNNDVVYFNNL